jgi:hypothetical protein
MAGGEPKADQKDNQRGGGGLQRFLAAAITGFIKDWRVEQGHGQGSSQLG